MVMSRGPSGAPQRWEHFSKCSAASSQMLYVSEPLRRPAQTSEACALLKEIESACRLTATGVVNNSHLQAETTVDDILQESLSLKSARLLNLPLAFTTVLLFWRARLKKPGECLSSRNLYKNPLRDNNPQRIQIKEGRRWQESL